MLCGPRCSLQAGHVFAGPISSLGPREAKAQKTFAEADKKLKEHKQTDALEAFKKGRQAGRASMRKLRRRGGLTRHGYWRQ